ncbi:MAG TPA: glycosyltransferase family 2 protein [Candidatus Dormibacteraeota bacterium]|nr:glycosyltransferase family 2 protein [Candidatus Dormibacteraeota bacterium]
MPELSVAVVIPAHNESARLPALLSTLPPRLPGVASLSVIVVDDGSQDGTADIARTAGVTVVRHGINLGKGAALRTGCEAALRRHADIVVAMDADGQHQAGDLPALLEPLLAGRADLVLGYRQREGAMPLVLRLGNVAMNRTLQVLFGVQFADTQCGFRAFSLAAYEVLRWNATDYAVESEMLVRAARASLRYSEVPIATIYLDRFKGTQPLDGLRILGQLVRWRIVGP